ncbi:MULTISPECIES: N-acetyl-D-Glu racemase DgcA [unclassified Agarivorans]|uniref:N-acetyl-D-Glu racemase DgcA n=1 Tax=unclassified Agarivorans TaxID=2636026 RepID=UPI003D7CE8AE
MNKLTRSLQIEVVELPLAKPFAISRGTRNAVTVVRVAIEEGGLIGLGECTPTAHYQQSAETVVAQLKGVQAAIEAGATRQQLADLLPRGSARNALDCALWRLTAAQSGTSLWSLTQRAQPRLIVAAETLSLASLEAMVEAAREAVARGAKLLKIKLDAQQVLEKVAAIRAVAPLTVLIIDANEAWGSLDLEPLLVALQYHQIAMVEQPLPAGQDQALSKFQHPIPLCADESCHDRHDIAGLSGRYELINIKLDKCGGLSEALAMVKVAQRREMGVMVGCMLGSSLAMEAALPVATDAEFVDLDGPLWLAADSAPHLVYQNGCIYP